MKYVGQELHIFEKAKNWKNYWSSVVSQEIRGDTLEVGAGIGANTAILLNDSVTSWTQVEPDPDNARALINAFQKNPVVQILEGTLESIDKTRKFHTILYVDVLEHIHDDMSELHRASELLHPGGHLLLLSPAHQSLFSPFDHSVGHYRRYNKEMLRRIMPSHLLEKKLIYLDSVGYFASWLNRSLLKADLPTSGQILTWDRLMIPVSRMLDPVIRYTFGKTILGVWVKKNASA